MNGKNLNFLHTVPYCICTNGLVIGTFLPYFQPSEYSSNRHVDCFRLLYGKLPLERLNESSMYIHIGIFSSAYLLIDVIIMPALSDRSKRNYVCT